MDGVRSRRRLWVVILLAAGPCIVAVFTGWRYLNRPLFAGEFFTHELSFLPNWHYTPRFDDAGGLFIGDERRNQALFLAPPATGRWLTPTGDSQKLVILCTSGCKIVAGISENSATLVATDGAVLTAPLQPGAERVIAAWADEITNDASGSLVNGIVSEGSPLFGRLKSAPGESKDVEVLFEVRP